VLSISGDYPLLQEKEKGRPFGWLIMVRLPMNRQRRKYIFIYQELSPCGLKPLLFFLRVLRK